MKFFLKIQMLFWEIYLFVNFTFFHVQPIKWNSFSLENLRTFTCVDQKENEGSGRCWNVLKNDLKLHYELPGHFRRLYVKQKFNTKKISIFLGNLSMTQILDSNWFWGQKNFSKFLDLYCLFDSYMFIYKSFYLSIYLSIYLPIYQYIYFLLGVMESLSLYLHQVQHQCQQPHQWFQPLQPV